MPDQLLELFATDAWWGTLTRIIIFFSVAWLIHRLASRLVNRVAQFSRFTSHKARARPEREETLKSIMTSSISFVAYAGAMLASLGQFVPTDTLVWMVGLFSAAFGLGARPLISDVLTGIGLLFEDTYAFGEKVEIQGAEGVVEAINLRTTWIRAPSGEIFVIPNGEVRIVRNFSRGKFSIARIVLKVASSDLDRALFQLEELGKEAMLLLPNLLEPWQVLSESGVIGQQTELTVLAKARFGQAAEMRPRALALVQARLAEEGILLAD